MPELLLEIGTEEIPAGFVPKALAAMEKDSGRRVPELRVDGGAWM